MIKKIFLILVVAVSLGSIMGIFLHDKFSEEVLALGGEKLIFLREGVYTTDAMMKENTKKIDPKLVIEDDNKYYVYVGITSNKMIANKIKKYYDDMDIEIYEKEINVSDETFINNVREFDSLILSSHDNDIMTVEEVILSNYEEVFGNGA